MRCLRSRKICGRGRFVCLFLSFFRFVGLKVDILSNTEISLEICRTEGPLQWEADAFEGLGSPERVKHLSCDLRTYVLKVHSG